MDRKQEILILIDSLVAKTQEKMESDIKMNAGDIVEITLYVMLLVERSPHTLSGEDKLHVATETINKILDLLPDLSKEEKFHDQAEISSQVNIGSISERYFHEALPVEDLPFRPKAWLANLSTRIDMKRKRFLVNTSLENQNKNIDCTLDVSSDFKMKNVLANGRFVLEPFYRENIEKWSFSY